ncbi:MAG: PadR family transcriptional regulator [Planctomycetota bacterium]|jgi:DNA-binding PadR family transcriptional regulator
MLISNEDLEMVVLGIVLKRGPCTPYAVRKELETSPSRHFSSSPGSVYPIIRRLETQGWLRSEAGLRGKQRRRLYAITDRGRRALRQWLTPPLSDSAVGMTFDPLRTRLYFLAALPRRQRATFLGHAAERLDEEVARARADVRRYEASGDDFSRLAAEGGLDELRTRLRWIRKVAAAVE